MNILIVGANGLLGRHLVEILSQNHKIVALVKDTKNLNFRINNNISLLEMNLNNIDLTRLPNNIDAIYYLAQSNKYKYFPEGMEDMIYINILSPNIIAQWASKNGVKSFFYASSGGVYGNINSLLKESHDISKSDQLSFYLSSKLSSEMLLKNYENLIDIVVIIRPFFIYGPGQNKTMLIPKLISDVENEKEITLNGNNGIKINPIYVTDAAKAFANLINIRTSFVINIAGDHEVFLKELILMIGAEIDKSPIIKINDKKQNNLVADNSLMREMLFKPKIDLKTGIKNIIKYNQCF
tara:strand:- start:859 stop:1746 length:888 start_codon:yes stop_codon:yes gene_type:complete